MNQVPFRSLYWANWTEGWFTQFPNNNPKVQRHSDRVLRGLGGLGVFVFKTPCLHCVNKLLFSSIEILLYLNISLLSPLFTDCFVAHNKELQLFLIFNRSMSSSEAKTLRVCANSFLDHLSLVVETIEAFGPPLEESWLYHIPLLLIDCENLNSP